MNGNPAEEVLSDLLAYLETLETQSGAVLELLKARGIATNEELAPYLEQAASATSVKWSAVRMRMERVFAVAKEKEPNADKAQTQRAEAKADPDSIKKEEKNTKEEPASPEPKKESEPTQAAAVEEKAEQSPKESRGVSAESSPRPAKEETATARKTTPGKTEERDSESTTPEKDAA